MSQRVHDLSTNPIHLGLGATAVVEPPMTGDLEWYGGYGERHGVDGAEGRLVAMHTYDGAWDSWEMHPVGAEVVLCIKGTIELIQEINGLEIMSLIGPGQYAINPPGVWHTANDSGPCTAVFITAGVGTRHRPR